jgi:kinesin family protein 1
MSGASPLSPSLGSNGSPSLPGESTWDASLPPEKQLVQYKTSSGEVKTISKAELQDQLEASEKLMASVTETWEQKLEKTKEVQKEREKALESLGITIEKNLLGVHTPKKVSQMSRARSRKDFELMNLPLRSQMPHLVNLNEDPLMSECLICMPIFPALF